MCKARTITHQGKVISATGIHNHEPHVSPKYQSQHSYNHMPTTPSEYFNSQSIATTSSHPLIQPYQPFMQHPMSPNQLPFASMQNSRSPNILHPPSGSFKMENI